MATKEAVDNIPVVYVSTCLNELQILSRVLPIAGNVSILKHSPLFLHYNQNLTIDLLADELRRFVWQNNIKVVYEHGNDLHNLFKVINSPTGEIKLYLDKDNGCLSV